MEETNFTTAYRITPKGLWVAEYMKAHPELNFEQVCEAADQIWLDGYTKRDS